MTFEKVADFSGGVMIKIKDLKALSDSIGQQRPFDTPQSVTLRHGGAAIKKHDKIVYPVRAHPPLRWGHDWRRPL
jgi:hypothetical protein